MFLHMHECHAVSEQVGTLAETEAPSQTNPDSNSNLPALWSLTRQTLPASYILVSSIKWGW